MKLPLRIRRRAEAFLIDDAANVSVCALYFENEPGRRNSTNRMDSETAEKTAKRIARLLTDDRGD